LKKKVLSVEDILKASDVKEKEIYVEEWKGTVKIRGLTKEAELRIRKEAEKGGGIDEALFEKLLFKECVVEPKLTLEQVEEVFKKSSNAVNKVLLEIVNISGLYSIDSKDVKDFFR
jgi:hypothetical protein